MFNGLIIPGFDRLVEELQAPLARIAEDVLRNSGAARLAEETAATVNKHATALTAPLADSMLNTLAPQLATFVEQLSSVFAAKIDSQRWFGTIVPQVSESLGPLPVDPSGRLAELLRTAGRVYESLPADLWDEVE